MKLIKLELPCTVDLKISQTKYFDISGISALNMKIINNDNDYIIRIMLKDPLSGLCKSFEGVELMNIKSKFIDRLYIWNDNDKKIAVYITQ